MDKDIEKLCNDILNMNTDDAFNSNCPDYSYCPYCRAKMLYEQCASIDDLDHYKDCIYVQAKMILQPEEFL